MHRRVPAPAGRGQVGARGELRCLFGGADWLCGRWLAPGKSAWHDSLNSPPCCGRGDKQCLSRLVLLFFVCRQGAKKELELWQAEHPGQLEEDVGSRHYADKLQASRFSRRAGFMVWYGMCGLEPLQHGGAGQLEFR